MRLRRGEDLFQAGVGALRLMWSSFVFVAVVLAVGGDEPQACVEAAGTATVRLLQLGTAEPHHRFPQPAAGGKRRSTLYCSTPWQGANKGVRRRVCMRAASSRG